ncbi:MAG: hypothetical protein GY928_38375 [Colwellia sp.]|nr:hypothetical protein [Colwellia sp.]
MDKKIYGKDKSSEYPGAAFNLKPMAIGISKGSVEKGGVFKRQSEAFLQYCVTGTAMDCKGDAFDTINYLHLSFQY